MWPKAKTKALSFFHESVNICGSAGAAVGDQAGLRSTAPIDFKVGGVKSH